MEEKSRAERVLQSEFRIGLWFSNHLDMSFVEILTATPFKLNEKGSTPENIPDAQFAQRLKRALEYVPAEQGWQTKSSLAIKVLYVPVDHKTAPAPSMSTRFMSF